MKTERAIRLFLGKLDIMKVCDLTTPEGLAEFIKQRATERAELTLKKNNDYAAPGLKGDDPFKVFNNFMAVERRNICPAETGLLVRITDKYERMVNLMHPRHSQAVSDESLKDTILDLQNYLDILAALMELRSRSDCTD